MSATVPPKRTKHCLGGKVSLVLALLGVLAAVTFIFVARKYIPRSTPVGAPASVRVYVVGFLVTLGLFLLGTLAGIVGLFSRTRKRVLAVTGTLFCGTVLILVATWTVLVMAPGQ